MNNGRSSYTNVYAMSLSTYAVFNVNDNRYIMDLIRIYGPCVPTIRVAIALTIFLQNYSWLCTLTAATDFRRFE